MSCLHACLSDRHWVETIGGQKQETETPAISHEERFWDVFVWVSVGVGVDRLPLGVDGGQEDDDEEEGSQDDGDDKGQDLVLVHRPRDQGDVGPLVREGVETQGTRVLDRLLTQVHRIRER